MWIDEGVWLPPELVEWSDLPVPYPDEVDLDLDWELPFDCMPD